MAEIQIVKSSDLVDFADKLARSIRSRLVWSKKLRGKVKVGRAYTNKNFSHITIRIAPNDENLQGMALAFEKGSGLRGTKRRRYLIPGRPFLAFMGTNGYGNAYGTFDVKTRKGMGSKNIVVTRQVMHPGVAPRPFIAPAIEATLPKASQELALRIRKNLVDGMRIVLKDIK